MLTLGLAVGTQLAAVLPAPILRPVDKRARARWCRAGPEASEPMRLHDLDQRCGRRRSDVGRDRPLPGPKAYVPHSLALLKPRDGIRFGGNLVQHPSRLADVVRLEYPP